MNRVNRLSVFTTRIIPLLLLITSTFSHVQFAYAYEPVSVAVVNVTFLMENAPQSVAASNQLKEKFTPQEKKLADQQALINKRQLELDKNKASGDQKTEMIRQKERELRALKRTRERQLQDFREELRFARDAALDVVQKEVFSAIDEVRKKRDIDIVLQDYLSASKRVDITPLVLEYLKNKIETPQNNHKDEKDGK